MPISPRRPGHPSRLLVSIFGAALILTAAMVGCDDDSTTSSSNGTPMQPMESNLSGFRGAWIVRSTGDPQFFCPAGCEDRLADLIDTYFSISAADSLDPEACVVVDSLRHLLLVEPFMSEGECTGFADTQGETSTARVECEHAGRLLGDSLLTSIGVTVVSQPGDAFQASFVIQTRSATPGDDCSGCRALFGMAGVKRLSGECP